MPILPALPELEELHAVDQLCGDTRRCVPTWTTASFARAAFTIARPSSDRVADRLLDVHVRAASQRRSWTARASGRACRR